jgi:thiamine pyrophosphate-dependent acetolactate synthase large subunit-like protein
MTRSEATERVARHLRNEAVVVSLGHPAYDLFVAADRPQNFYTWGSMGLTSSIALGLALARPDRRVVSLDGDGSLLMNLGALATIGSCVPPNLLVIVWDNGQYGTTGGQPTATACRADLAAAARAMGLAAHTVATPDELDEALERVNREPQTTVIVAKVAESAPRGRPPLDCAFIKHRFMSALGVTDEATIGRGEPSDPRTSRPLR